MAVSLPTSSDYLQRTTNVVNANSDYTCIFWARNNNTPSTSGVLFVTFSDPIGYSPFCAMFPDDVAGTNKLQIGDGGSVVTSDTPFTNTVWYPLAYVRSGSNHSFYSSGILIGTVTENISAGTLGQILLGNDAGTSDDCVYQFSNFREWNVALSAAQILAEINSPSSVVHTSNLVTFTPLTSDLLDISGNGNDWTQVGSISFVADPAFPSNTSSVAAIDLGSIPVELDNIVVNPTGTFIFTTWYKYTKVSSDYVLWFFAIADLVNFFTDTRPFIDPNGAFLTNNGYSAPFILPVSQFADGTVIYLKVIPGNGSNNNVVENLTVKVQRWINNVGKAGYVIIPTDGIIEGGTTFPLSFVNPNIDEGISTYVNGMPATELMSILPDGTIAMGSDDGTTPNDGIYIFDSPTLTQQAHTSGFTPICITKAGDGSGFYFIETGDLKLRTMSKTGVIGGTVFGISGQTVCISPDNSIAYYNNGSTNLNTGRIHRWDLNANSAMSDLTWEADNSHTWCRDFLCLSDGSLILMDQAANRIYHLSSAGAVLNTITPPIVLDANFNLDRMCIDPDGATFWCYLRGNGAPQVHGFLNLVHLQVDGTVLSNKTTVVYSAADGGGFDQQASTLTPIMYGPSDSCPIGIAVFDYSPPNLGGTLVVGKASNPLASGVNFSITGPNGTFTLQTDTPGQTIAVAPGTYSITEAANPTYKPNYFVSNDPVNNNNLAIVVGSNELVDVVIENALSTKFGGLYQLVPGKTNDTLRNQDGSTTDFMINWFAELFTNRDK